MSISENNEYVTILKSRLEKIEKLESTPMIMRDQAVQCLRTVLKKSQLIEDRKSVV